VTAKIEPLDEPKKKGTKHNITPNKSQRNLNLETLLVNKYDTEIEIPKTEQ
jgi:hypothetical protein